jgi:hypothetical protein
MSIKKILEDDWSEYDNKKIRGRQDAKDFACTEPWEVEYLLKKIKKHHPELTETAIKLAIEACCRALPAPHPRQPFVECVAKRLYIPAA